MEVFYNFKFFWKLKKYITIKLKRDFDIEEQKLTKFHFL